MTSYLRPGVFINETLTPLVDNLTSDSVAVAAFVGVNDYGGPTTPTLVTSWSQYQQLFGSIKANPNDLAFGVYSFFNNGGSFAYIIRGVASTATAAASLTVKDTQATAADTLKITANSVGTWANSGTGSKGPGVFVTITPSSSGDQFDLLIELGQGSGLIAREVFTGLSLDPASGRNALAVVNSTVSGSKYVNLSKVGTWSTAANNPAAVTATALATGSDGTGTVDLAAAAQALANIDADFVLNLPGVTDSTVISSVVSWAEGQQNVFVVIDAPAPLATDSAASYASSLQTAYSSITSSYGAVYGPWLNMQNPATNVPGATRLTAPGGSVVGQIVRTDVLRGVQKAPAGLDTSLSGVVSPWCVFASSDLDSLNQAGINVIRPIPGKGTCIFGARTLNRGYPDRYINIRRSLIVIKRLVKEATRFAVFEPNNSDLWDTLRAILQAQLLTLFQQGVLSGNTPDQAYYVICDETNNTQQSVNAGTVNVSVGVALSSPAEFIVINIGQFDGGATVSESTDTVAA